MSTLKVTNIQDTSGGNSATTEQIYKGIAKAWVNFDGTLAGTRPFTSSGGIRSSFNVSSITYNGDGDHTINFINAMPNANYCCLVTGSTINYGSVNRVTSVYETFPPTSSSVRILSAVSNGNNTDPIYVNVSIFT